MKRVRCPKCDHYIIFDETKYQLGQSLVFKCENCNKEFSIRMGVSKLAAQHAKDETYEEEKKAEFGYITVVENVFAFRQELPLSLGDNEIGRYNRGTEISNPVQTSDPSMDRHHCIVNVSLNRAGEPVYTVMDNESSTGTFVMDEILKKKEKRRIHDGDIITCGATTLILHEKEQNENK
ncbi:MAG: FHA domain-containing protein [Bacteroidaceae bacterium]|jgi:uncharacterized protein YbaR (Trm112 family)|nr:FHA domain-containing protein [Bacteroidaceae bacterium]